MTSVFSRRTLLDTFRLGAGAAFLAPVLRGFDASANPMGPASRVVFFVSGNGFLTSRVPPELNQANGRAPQASGVPLVRTFAQLAPTMAPLQRYASRITQVHDLYHGVGGGHWHGYPALTCKPGGTNGTQYPLGPSIDALLAQRNAARAPIPHLALAATDSPQEFDRGLLAAGSLQPIILRANPASTLARLFGASGAEDKERLARKDALLEWLKVDVARVRQGLVGQEKLKFDAFMNSVEQLQATQNTLALYQSTGKCSKPSGAFTLDRIEGRFQSFVAIAATALGCGLTNHATIAVNTLGSFGALYKGLGYSMGLHGLGHGGNDPVMGGGDRPIQAFHAEQIASFCDRLALIPEGSGTVLDKTLVVWLNENGSTHHSRPWHPWSVTLIGNAGGKLKPGGRAIFYPFNEQGSGPNVRRVADLFRTLGVAVNTSIDAFGEGPGASVHGPLVELLA
jgi:hypothetical protein